MRAVIKDTQLLPPQLCYRVRAAQQAVRVSRQNWRVHFKIYSVLQRPVNQRGIFCIAVLVANCMAYYVYLCSVEEEDEFSEGRRQFLEACRLRSRQRPLTAPGELENSPRGPEDIVAGCGCFLRLSSRPKTNAVQILLLAVRHRWRRAGLGSFLLQVIL